MSVPELRRDPILGHQTIIAPGRADRPVVASANEPAAPTAVEDPFLVGNESETPAERFRIDGPDGDWSVRVVPNRYPALIEQTEQDQGELVDPFESRPAVGQHEVIVECPHFEQQLAELPEEQIARVLTVWQSRLQTIARAGNFDYALIFKNSGRRAGASLPHSHSQLTAMPTPPDAIQRELSRAQLFYEQRGAALQDYVLERECQQQRTVYQSPDLVAFCPFASRFSFETWIVPAGQTVSFISLPATGLNQLAAVLRSVLQGLLTERPGVPYNLMLHASPLSQCEELWFRWRLEVCPRPAQLAGFELATGRYINTVAPETAAVRLSQHIK